MIRIVSWNLNQRKDSWRELAASDADVALVQEAKAPPEQLLGAVEVASDAPWVTPGLDGNRRWRTAVAKLSDEVDVAPIPMGAIGCVDAGGLGVSRPGTLDAAFVSLKHTGETLILVSVYGLWERPAIQEASREWIYADASVHRVISDVSALIRRQTGHRIIVAGDLNVLRGYGENGSTYWGRRYQTVFDRMEAIGLPFVGPELPDGGRPAQTPPAELPDDSLTVPTYRVRRNDPESATRQLDFVFASVELHDRLRVKALNDAENWGPSDHCRVLIELDG